ncbi:Protoporphyrinogen oxidase [Nibea albiflora]|uniref:Protoporphyrinogen oxidase n=1 Tax=Nibea albiflora TaxID=240163 RepID=A0ACB7F5K5_NIBAL|nr:Protoporphyrinogen oxidase [Nibea albiflora]
MRTVAVLGGGIGGLAASYYLCKSSQVTKVIVLESSSRFGGWLQSTRRSDGAVFEHGPRGFRPAGAVGRNTLNMVDDLGLGGEILPVTYNHLASKNRYLYVNKQLHRMPSGISGLLRTVPPFSRPLLLSVAMEIFVKKGTEDDESIHSFASRRLGKELADIAVDSLCRGVFAGDSRKLSVRSCFPPLYNAEQHRGSLTLGMLLGSVLPSSCQLLIEYLQDIYTATVAVVNLEYEGSIMPVEGFGHLLPSSEDLGLLGVVYDSFAFPQHNRPNGKTTRLTVMMGGVWFQEVFGSPESVTEQCLLAKATEAVHCHLGVTTAPIWSRVALQKNCIPQYYHGHFRRVESMRSFIRKNNLSLSLIGSSYDGVSVNDVIFSGRKAVEELLGTEV